MAAHAIWQGYLRLSLVNCPVRLYAAMTQRERISFHLLTPDTHRRIGMRPTDPETGKAYPRSALQRGYEYEKGRYVIVEEEELDRLKIESSHTIDLAQFVEPAAVDPVFFDTPYYLAPDGKAAGETFRVIAEAMRRTSKAGIGRLVLAAREHAVLVAARDRGMLLATLRPADEVRDPAEVFGELRDGPLDDEAVALAEQIIERRTAPFKPAELAADRYQAALHELIETKLAGRAPAETRAAPARSNVHNLIDALKRSVAAERGGRPPAAATRRRPARRRAAAKLARRRA